MLFLTVAAVGTLTFGPAIEVKLQAFEPVAIRYDVDRLCKAIAYQETKNCQYGVGKQHNCHGLFKDGKSMTFASPAESQAQCMAIWRGDSYGRFPDLSLATRWVCGPDYQYGRKPIIDGKCDGHPLNDPANWLEKVTSRYHLYSELALN